MAVCPIIQRTECSGEGGGKGMGGGGVCGQWTVMTQLEYLRLGEE